MNLLFRFVWLLITQRFRSRIGALDEAVTPFRVWPTDLDLNRHMNNGRFLQVMDLARVDLMARSGLIGVFRRERLGPVVASQSIRYRRSLLPFRKFVVRTRVLGWDDRFLYLQQTLQSKGETVASAVVKSIFLHPKRGRVQPGELLELAGLRGDELELPEWVARWVEFEDGLWEHAPEPL